MLSTQRPLRLPRQEGKPSNDNWGHRLCPADNTNNPELTENLEPKSLQEGEVAPKKPCAQSSGSAVFRLQGHTFICLGT